MIKPCVGRVVWFTPAVSDDPRQDIRQPLAAMIAYVHSDRCINLTAYDQNGNYLGGRTSVPLLQDDDPKPELGYFASWMPYQKGQAAKTEQLEAAIARPAAPLSDAQIEEEIQAKGLTASRLTPEQIESAIAGEEYVVFGGRLTVCNLTLKNGFLLTGESSCVSAANFDQELGRKIAREDAKRKVWMLEGYLLRQKLHDAQFAKQV